MQDTHGAGTAARPDAAKPHGHAPAVSVVVPCYNGGRFIDQMIGALARQSFRDFEIVIVDDGSDDPATQRKLASLGPATRVIRQANRGLPAARNAGIEAARANLVMPLDCDDMIEPPFLAEAVALLDAAPADVAAVFSHMRLTGAASGLLERQFNRFDLLFTNTLPSGLLLRKTAWRAVGGYDESMREGYEDWEFHLRLAHSGYRAIEIAKPYYVYSVSLNGMLLERASREHGRLWRAIRRKHAALYRLPALVRLWRETRDGSGRVSAGKAIAAYAMSALLPDALFSRLVGRRRHRLLVEGDRQAYASGGPIARNAVLSGKS